jgi:hypothetical protein
MPSWNDEHSVLAPLMLGLHQPYPDYSGVPAAFAHACTAVPSVPTIRNAKVSWRGTRQVRHAREVHSVPGVDGWYRRRARCIDRVATEQLADAVNRWTWEVGYCIYKDGVLAPAIPAGLTPVLLDVSRFKLNAGAVRGAPQLALFRALFVQGLREIDPDLVVVGGQREWHDTMWTFAATIG